MKKLWKLRQKHSSWHFDIKPGIGMWDMLKTMKPEAMTNMISGIQDGFIESLNSRLIKIKK